MSTVKTVFTVFVVLLLGISNGVKAQEYNNPESIVYDVSGDRYFVSNKGGNTIVTLKDGVLSDFVTEDLQNPKGLLIKGDTLISVNNTFVSGYKLADGTRIFKHLVSGSSFMNDATLVESDVLYVTDSSKALIFKLSLSDGTSEIYASEGIRPNGILFDQANNRLIFCEWGENAKIKAIDLTDASITDLATTGVANLDGLAFNSTGHVYFSSWGANSVYRYSPSFEGEKEVISENHDGPADISIDKDKNVLAVPNFMNNTVELIPLKTEVLSSIKASEKLSVAFQNPVAQSIVMDRFIDGYSLYSLNGTMLQTGNVPTNSIEVAALNSGIYILIIKQGLQYFKTKVVKH